MFQNRPLYTTNLFGASTKTQKKCKWNEINRLKRFNRSEDNLFKQTVYSGNFPVGSTKNVWNLCVNGKQPLYFDCKLTNVIPQTFRHW